MDYLRLLAWCKDLPQNAAQYLHADTWEELFDRGFVRENRSGTCFRSAVKALDVLNYTGFDYPQDKRTLSAGSVLSRRLELSELTLFLYSLRADVFLDSPTQYRPESLCFLPSFALRRKQAANILGGTRLAGFLYSPQTTFVPYFIRDGREGLYPHAEQAAFHGEYLSNKKPAAVVYTGKSDLDELIRTVHHAEQVNFRTKAVTFRDAMKDFSCPVCFVPLSEDGLRQLRIMCVPDYKIKLAKASLENEYRDSKYTWCDSYYMGEPLIIGVDFNLKGFEQALEYANGSRIHILVLDFQMDVLREYFLGKSVKIHSIKIREVEEILRLPKALRTPDFSPYQTKEGGFINTTDFKTHRKIGRPGD